MRGLSPQSLTRMLHTRRLSLRSASCHWSDSRRDRPNRSARLVVVFPCEEMFEAHHIGRQMNPATCSVIQEPVKVAPNFQQSLYDTFPSSWHPPFSLRLQITDSVIKWLPNLFHFVVHKKLTYYNLIAEKFPLTINARKTCGNGRSPLGKCAIVN